MDILKLNYLSTEFEKDFTSSLHETGFAIVDNHPISQDLIDKVYNDWKFFFNDNRKNDYLFDYEKQDGYFPFKSESAKGKDEKDLKEFFHIYPLWGRYPKFINNDTLILYEELIKLGKQLLKHIDKYCPEEIRIKFSEPLHKMSDSSDQNLMRVIHYPPLSQNINYNSVRAAAHTDINLITVLVSGSQPGLQVKDKEGNWIDVKSKKGQMVINIGDMLQECSDGYYPSTVHQVINTTNNTSRFSIPLFLHPRPDVVLSKKYTADSYLFERLKELGLK
ncbi:MAG: 2OG-Fe(II) oxygenase [Candidatus Marinimicrobia bacterium]|nr:2OG-Fe(II) oxygenase [Candidatus Neomarinimicrobiota bacterium]|tara:strand:- start:18433 stop:19263 length:831 start_codon:yes stop_codon:yes gene_type:complete